MPRQTGGGAGGKPTAKGVSTGRALTAQAHRKEIEQHVRDYPKAPKQHARALRDLGLSSKQIRYVHRSSQGLNPKGARKPIKPAQGKVAGLIGFGAKIGEDISNAAIYFPVGAYRVGEAGAKDIASTARGKPTLRHSAGIGKQIGKGVYEDFRHPGRHPGNLILDVAAGVGAIEGAVSRAGAAGRALKAGEGARKAVTRKGREGGGVIHRPATGRIQHEVVGEHGKMVVETPASKRAGVAAIQRRRAAKASAGPQAERVAGKALTKERRVTEAIERAPIEALAHKSKRLSTPQQTALRVYNEGKSIPERVAFHEGHREKAGRGSAAFTRHQQKVLLLKAAAHYLEHDKNGVPHLRKVEHALDKKDRRQLLRLHDAQASLERVAKTREERLAALGDLQKGSAEARVQMPGAIIAGKDTVRTPDGQLMERVPGTTSLYSLERDIHQARTVLKGEQRKLATLQRKMGTLPASGRRRARPMLEKRIAARQKGVAEWQGEVAKARKALDEQGPQLKPVTGGRARIPYAGAEAPRSYGRPANYRGGIPQTPGSIAHEFKGGLLHSGNFREDTGKLVAESGVEAQRHTAVVRLRDRVATAARDKPREGDIAIRLEGLKGKPFPANVQAVLRKREEGVKLNRTESQLLRDELEKVREEVFPQIDPLDHGQHPDVRWINPELLNAAQQQAFKLSNAVGDRPVEVIDAINNASKLAILYLKPAYAVPNIAGNAFLNIVQQGMLAPANWARSGHLYKKLGDDAAATLDSVMGEGVARSLSTGEGAGQKAVAGIAGKWSSVVDLVFRRAAFIHEARRLGYKGPAELKRLLTDEAHRADLQEVAQRAKDAIIDYDNLGQREKEIVRRLVFFYPWVKGSTMYAGHFALEHPIQTAVAGNLGEFGKEHTGLPGVGPSYLQGSFQAGGKLVNPASAAVFQTPAQVYQALHALQHGNVTEAARLGSFATPAADLAISEIARTDSFGHTISPQKSGLDIAKESLVQSLPQVTLVNRLRRAGGPNEKDRLFPIKKKGDAVYPFLVGGGFPRRFNPEQYQKQGRREQRSLHGRHENAISDYKQSQKDLSEAFRKVGEKRIPRPVAARLMLKRERHLNRIQASGGHDMTSAEAFSADVDLLVKHRWMSPAEAKHAKGWATKAPKTDVSNALGYLTRNYFDRDGLLSDSLKYLREHGSPDAKVPTLP